MSLEGCLTQEVELIPDQVATINNPFPTGFASGWMDWAGIAGLPLWFLFLMGTLLLLIGVIFNFVLKTRSMAPVAGFRNPGIDPPSGSYIIGWLMNSDTSLVCLPMTNSAGTIHTGDTRPDEKSTWLHTNPNSIIKVDGRGGVVLSADYAFARDLGAESAWAWAIYDYNRQFPDNPEKQIIDFEDWCVFGRHALIARHPQGLEVPTYRILDPEQIRHMIPKHHKPRFFGELLAREAKNLLDDATAPEGFFEKYITVIAAMTIGIIAIIGVAAFG